MGLKTGILTPVDAVKKMIAEAREAGWKPVGISFGQRDWTVFMRDFNQKKIKLVGDPDVISISKFEGLDVYYKTAPGTDLLFKAADNDGKGEA